MKKILFLIFLSFIICEENFGNYTRRSFKENSFEIEVTYKVAEKASISFFKTYLNKTSKFTIYPLSVYSQLVKGTNFKYIFASLERNGNMAVITTTVYLGLNETAPQFKNIVAADKIQKEEFEDFSNMENAIKNVYKNEFKNNETLTGFKNVLFEDAGDSYYFVRLNSKNGDYALVYKDSNGNYTVDYIIKEFRMIKE
jgi:hypothetical protein